MFALLCCTNVLPENWSVSSIPIHRENPRTIHMVVSGYVRECEMVLSTLMDIPVALIGLLAEYCTTLFRWETRDSDIEIYDNTKCRRIDEFTGSHLWRNCFGALSVGYPFIDTFRRFQWTLQCHGKVTIGFMEKHGAERCMLNNFVHYDDGYGVYRKTPKNIASKVIVELQWFRSEKSWKCRFLLDDEVKFVLPPKKEYKLTVALSAYAKVACIEYQEYER